MGNSRGHISLHWAPEAAGSGDSTNYKSSVKIYSETETGYICRNKRNKRQNCSGKHELEKLRTPEQEMETAQNDEGLRFLLGLKKHRQGLWGRYSHDL